MSKQQVSSATRRGFHSQITVLLLVIHLTFGQANGGDDRIYQRRSDDDGQNDKNSDGASSKTTKRQRPHIWMIIVDDLGSNDLGFHGSGIHTPNIDSLLLAESNNISKCKSSCSSTSTSILMDQYYVLPCCSPTRASLLSGKYPLHHGIHSYIEDYSTVGLPLDVETLPNLLKRSKGDGGEAPGYETRAVGKWHLGHAKWEYTPTFRGFDSFYGFYRGGEDYYTHSAKNAYDLRYDKQPNCGRNCSKIVDMSGQSGSDAGQSSTRTLDSLEEQYSTHLFTKEAIRVVKDYGNRKHSLERAHLDLDEEGDDATLPPLFLYLAFQAVHAPDQVPSSYKDRYSDRTDWSDVRKTYAGMLTAADAGIGNITRLIQNDYPDIWDNLLIVFTTDNGGPTSICAVQGSSNHPKRGGKCTVWEGGTTGDGFVSGPYLTKLLNEKDAKTTKATSRSSAETSKKPSKLKSPRHYSHLFHVVDWLPTLAEIVGVQPKDGSLDGKGQLDGWKHNVEVRDHVHIGYAYAAFSTNQWYGPAIRHQQWKLIQGLSGGPNEHNLKPKGSKEPLPGGDGMETEQEYVIDNPIYQTNSGMEQSNSTYLLFDLANDPNEQHNVAAQFPEVVKSLVAKLKEYQKTYLPPQPEDPSCPFTGFVNTSMGPTWMPWCSEVVLYS